MASEVPERSEVVSRKDAATRTKVSLSERETTTTKGSVSPYTNAVAKTYCPTRDSDGLTYSYLLSLDSLLNHSSTEAAAVLVTVALTTAVTANEPIKPLESR